MADTTCIKGKGIVYSTVTIHKLYTKGSDELELVGASESVAFGLDSLFLVM